VDAGGLRATRDATIARQVAEALEEAHEKGIVHRDLKPANVKLTPDGKVQVLDFGLAKAWTRDVAGGTAASSDLSQSPTLAHTGTAAGLILGTAAYMSPEQARGKAVDKRTDIWAFGVVLFELLTGQRLFHGETVSDILAAVLKPWSSPTAMRSSTSGTGRDILPLDRGAEADFHEILLKMPLDGSGPAGRGASSSRRATGARPSGREAARSSILGATACTLSP
jgi:serine/threonine protein kinase